MEVLGVGQHTAPNYRRYRGKLESAGIDAVNMPYPGIKH